MRSSTKRLIVGNVVFFTLLFFTACSSSPSKDQGFQVVTQDVAVNSAGQRGVPIPRPYMPVSGDYAAAPPPNQSQGGTISHYNQFTDDIGETFVYKAKAPAYWNQYVTFDVPCGTANLVNSGFAFYLYEAANVLMSNKGAFVWDCEHFDSSLPGASTRLVIQDSTPSTLTLWSTQHPLSTAHGMPRLQLYNPDRSIAASVNASSVASDGTNATFPFPTLPNGTKLPANLYGGTILNKNASGGYNYADFNFFSIAAHQSFDKPFGVAASFSNTSYQYCSTSDMYRDGSCAGSTECTSNSSPSQFPVVSLYSQNTVIVGSTAIPVGLNPTTVVTYGEETFSDYQDTGCHPIDGQQSSYTQTHCCPGKVACVRRRWMNGKGISRIQAGNDLKS